MLVAQFVPLQPAAHEQLYEFTPSVHVALFWHGLDAHSSISNKQFVPLHPALHEQLYEAMPSVQTPFGHGFEPHSLIFVHVTPLLVVL